MSPLFAILGAIWLGGCTCSPPVVIEGQIIDLWGDPVAGATITVEGQDTVLTTDEAGTFTLPMLGDVMITIAKDGFVTRTDPIEPLDTTKTHKEPFEIVPIPEENGFYAIGPRGYEHIDSQPVATVDGGTRAWRGVEGTGEQEVEGDPLRIVYRTTLHEDQLDQLGLTLHRLERVDEAEVASIEGSTTVSVGLWVSAAKVPLVRRKLDDQTWALRVEELARGTYALVTMDLLDPDREGYDELAPELRRVNAFLVP